MNKLFLLIFWILSLSLTSNTIRYHIQGNVKDVTHVKFAYLSTLSQNRTISSSKIFMVTPVINGKFSFNGSFDLNGNDFQTACIFVNERGNISKEELASKFELLTWVIGRDNNLREIVLEDLTLEIEDLNKVKLSKVMSKGLLTKQSDDAGKAVRARNRKLLEFVKTHPDSPISFTNVVESTSLFELSRKEKYESLWGSPMELYAALSKRLQNSKKGIALKKEIYDKYNP